jgi:hypothetical protein
MRTNIPLLGIFIASIAVCFSCKKTGDTLSQNQQAKDSIANITAFTLMNANPQITLTSYSVDIQFPDTVYDASNMVATFTLSPGAKATLNGVEQKSGVTKNNFETPLTYVVTNASGYSKRWQVTTSNNNYTYNWGLGHFLQQSFTNDRSYSWYVNQAATGPFSSINCEPSCATMAAKWADSTFSRTTQEARDYYPQNTGEWSINTIQNYLAAFNFQSQNLFLGNSDVATRDSIKKQLDQHNIVVLQLNIGEIRSYSGICKDPRCDRYYPNYNWDGHAIVAYGYKEVDDEFYFQVMDPWGYGYINQDGTCKGINRFYRYEDIYNACIKADNIALIIYKK